MKTLKLFIKCRNKLVQRLLYVLVMLIILPLGSNASPLEHLSVTQVAVGKNADGRLELFVICDNEAVYHRWQLTPNGLWSDWASLNGGGIKQLVVTNYLDGSLVVFGLGTNGSIYQALQIAPNGSWANPWVPVAQTMQFKQISVAKQSNGMLVLFGIGVNDAVYKAVQASQKGLWSQFTSMNGGGIKQIVVGTNRANGTLVIFGLGTNQSTYYTWQLTPNNDQWNMNWVPLNGGGLNQIDIGNEANGALAIFGLGTNEATYCSWQLVPNGIWKDPWISLNGAGLAQITVASQANGLMTVFGLGTNQATYYTSQLSSNSIGWQNNWIPLNGGGLKQLYVSNYPNGALALFGVGSDGNVYQVWQTSPNGNWTNSWTSMASPSIPAKIVRGLDPNLWVKCVDIGFNCLTPEWQSVTYAKNNDGIGLCAGNYTTSDMPVVIEGNIHDSHRSTEDNFGAHQSYDYCANIEPDYKYQYLLGQCNSSENIAQFKDCNNEIVEAHNAKTLEMEWETNYFPDKFWPKDGDRAWIMGRWIYDMGHPPAQTEIHPPQAVSFTRQAPDGVNSYIYIYGCCTGAGGAEIPWTGSFYSVSKYNLNSFAIDYNINIYLPPQPDSKSTIAYTVIEKTYGGPDPIITPQPENGLLNIVCPLSGYFQSNPGAKFGLIVHSYWKTP